MAATGLIFRVKQFTCMALLLGALNLEGATITLDEVSSETFAFTVSWGEEGPLDPSYTEAFGQTFVDAAGIQCTPYVGVLPGRSFQFLDHVDIVDIYVALPWFANGSAGRAYTDYNPAQVFFDPALEQPSLVSATPDGFGVMIAYNREAPTAAPTDRPPPTPVPEPQPVPDTAGTIGLLSAAVLIMLCKR